MKRVKISEARLHFSALLDEIALGRKIVITRYGIPSALLVPIEITPRKLSHSEIVEAMRELRKRVKPGKMSVAAIVKQGRRERDRRLKLS